MSLRVGCAARAPHGPRAPHGRSRVRRAAALVAGGLALAGPAAAQPSAAATAAVRGVVVQAQGGAPVAGATVRVAGAAAGEATSDSLGRFVVGALRAGPAELTVRRLGLAPRTLALVLVAGDTARVVVRLGANPLRLGGIVVTARETTGADGGTTSRIARDAIEHVQASSLADVLQLVPGQLAVNPTLSDARQALLRVAPVASGDLGGAAAEAARAQALGTAIVVDGVPVSNNANLQTDLAILNSPAGTPPPFSSTANRGVDLRLLPADNVETVEVVRGVPSARHGDLTAGAVFVTSRVGPRAPELRVRANPTLLEASSVAGWALGAPAGGAALSVDGNLVSSQDDPRAPEGRFTRGTTQFALTRPAPADRADGGASADGPFAGFAATLRGRLWSTLDEQRRAPDDLRYQRVRRAEDRGGRADLQASWRAARPGGRASDGRVAPPAEGALRVDLTASATWTRQSAYHQELVTRDIFPVSDARADTTLAVPFGRSEYLSRVAVEGRPLNLYARLEATHRRAFAGARHAVVAGGEWRYDDNDGAGRQFDPREPPRQNYLAGDRPRSFADVPALAQIALYAEDRVRATALGRPLELQLGVRADALDARGLPGPGLARVGTTVGPRANVAWSLLPPRRAALLRVRGGYGVAAKAPTLAQLSPGPRFFDLVNVNYFAPNPAERLAVVTTRVVEPPTGGLRAARATKRELGLDLGRGGTFATLVAFDETTRGAFGTTRLPVVLPVARYRIAETPPGRRPVLDPTPASVDTLISAYDLPVNSRRIASRGIELTVDAPEWRALRTALQLNAAWTRTRATDEGRDITVDRVLGASAPARLGVYAGGAGVESELLVTSARLVHRAPAVGLVASLLVQSAWTQADRPLGREAPLAGYLDRSGAIVPLTPEQAASPEYAALRRVFPATALGWERRPALHLLNLRLAKALPGRTQLALSVNNALADRPLYQPRRTSVAGGARAFERRNPPLFFGMELVAMPFR